ncbi:hypothetical protein [Salinibacter ruber]|jgi:hypothetical protein|uniref:hypothetical protein n=1 Tax=Salinibacter ruber TaxID=146919 RepID=UPI002072AE8A|nr:hypothetical protein [Salinibacter ruber]
MKIRRCCLAVLSLLLLACGDTLEESQERSQAAADSARQTLDAADDQEQDVVITADSMRGFSQEVFNKWKKEEEAAFSHLVRVTSLDSLKQYVEVQWKGDKEPPPSAVFDGRKYYVDPDKKGFFVQVHTVEDAP